MNAVILARALLLMRPSLVAALGSAGKIFAGDAPLGTSLPLISIKEVVATDQHRPIAGGPAALVSARVQLTVIAGTYRQMKDVLLEAKFAARNFVGTLAGVPGVHISVEEAGPDYESESAASIQTLDLRVKFTESP